MGQAGQAVPASWRRSLLLTNPVLSADRQRATDRRDQGAAPEGQVPAGSAESTEPAAGLPGKGDPAAQQGGRLGPAPLGRKSLPEPTCNAHPISSTHDPQLRRGHSWVMALALRAQCCLMVPPPLPVPPLTLSGGLWPESVLTPPPWPWMRGFLTHCCSVHGPGRHHAQCWPGS